MSAPFDSVPGKGELLSYLHIDDVPAEDDSNNLVEAPQLAASSSEDSFGSSAANSLWSQGLPPSSLITSVSSACEIYEATRYYAGVGHKGEGPMLIYRDSPDKFEEPSGPEAYTRLMRIVPVPVDHEFGQNGKWDRIRDHVVTLLDNRGFSTTSVDFVRFTWLDKNVDGEVEEDNDDDDDDEDDDEDDSQDEAEEEPAISYDDIARIQPVECGKRHYTNPTIWIGVTPNSLTGADARRSCGEIRAYLNSLNVENVDIAFRESTYQHLRGHGPALFPSAEEFDALKDVVDNVSVLLSLPIVGYNQGINDTQGTMGPYFRVGNTLYAVTARHNLFSLYGNNSTYKYHGSGQKKKVLLMGPRAFNDYLASIQVMIDNHVDTVEPLQKQITALRNKIESGIDVAVSQAKLPEWENELRKTCERIEKMKAFFVTVKTKWSKPKDRVIGFVRWAPAIGIGIAPHRYTRDLCVIELYKDKFRNFEGNILSLGPEMPPDKLKELFYGRDDVPSEFKYPLHGRFPLRGMLTAEQLNNPNSLNDQGDRIRRVVKRGSTTNTTVGTLSGFNSFVRRYYPSGNQESIEVTILSHEADTGSFSRGGDSGALIASAKGEFVALLTGGATHGTDSADITYGTLFDWVREIVQEEFPGANFYFDNLQEFLADVRA
ncbi:hypothetical protein BN946_scf184910.g30 [Trametes cinnabarina]|uniref:Uncharacterized protein n=1 Tax=Pycnoporus cinnabarinus TaxID=5643 RepID=A0A060SAZ7_PYCCI|nr:hypothetical protein BN946_scf184910.g30 [Trametes cinnabarina]